MEKVDKKFIEINSYSISKKTMSNIYDACDTLPEHLRSKALVQLTMKISGMFNFLRRKFIFRYCIFRIKSAWI